MLNPIRLAAPRHYLVTQLIIDHPSAKADLLDPKRTRPELIALLQRISDFCRAHGVRLRVTAVRADHPTPDPAGSIHGHGEGWAADLWCDDLHVLLVACAKYACTVGLGGSLVQSDSRFVVWPIGDPRFVLFSDNAQPHVHVQAGNAYFEGVRS